MLSGTDWGYCGALCRTRNWTRSLWVSSSSADSVILYSTGCVAADWTSAGVRPKHIQSSPAVAAPSHSPPALFLNLAFLLPVETVGEVMAMVMVISHRILEWFGLEGMLKIIQFQSMFYISVLVTVFKSFVKTAKGS